MSITRQMAKSALARLEGFRETNPHDYPAFQAEAEREVLKIAEAAQSGILIFSAQTELPLWIAASRLTKKGILRRDPAGSNIWRVVAATVAA